MFCKLGSFGEGGQAVDGRASHARGDVRQSANVLYAGKAPVGGSQMKWTGFLSLLGCLLISGGVRAADRRGDGGPAFRAAPELFDRGQPETLGLESIGGRHAVLYSAPADGYKFCHHPNLIVYRQQLLCMWSNGKVGEDAPGQRILVCRTQDGSTWSKPEVLTEADGGRGICVAAGFHLHENRLVAYYTVTGGKNFHPATALMARTSTDGLRWSAPQRQASGFFIEGPRQLTGGRLLLAGEFVGDDRQSRRMRFLISDNPGGLGPWKEAHLPAIPPQQLGKFGYTEPSFFRQKSGALVATLRNYSGFLFATRSVDNGSTWSVPKQTNFPDTTARTSAGNLPDGTVYLINNSKFKRLDRSLLTIALSRDGRVFDRAFVLRGEPTKKRYPGQHKLDGWQYPHATVWKGALWVAYSVNKEDLTITRIPLRRLKK